MNTDPSKGIGRALFAALTQFADLSQHPELGSAKLILLGFSGTGSLVGRFAQYAPTVSWRSLPPTRDTIRLDLRR